MPLTVELDDGKRWRVCAARSRLQIKLRWTELEHPLLDPVRDVVYRHRTTRLGGRLLGLRVSQGNGVLTRAEGESAWTGTLSVEAGRFFSHEIRFVVEDARDPPRSAGVQLVTRGSAVLSLVVLVAALVVLAWRGAATLSTLHLNFSYSHALTGLGGLTLLGLAVKAVSTVTDELRVHGLPFWGMGYLLGRTLGACLLGASALGVLLPNCVTTVVNETEANIELKLPDSPGRLVLGPDQEITFLGRVDQVGYTVQSSFADEGGFCVVDERGLGVGICDPTPRQAALPGARDWWQRMFAPAALRVACKTRKYQVVQREGDVPLPSDVVALLLPSLLSQVSGPTSLDVPIELDARCQPKGPGRALLERPLENGFKAVYGLTEPWTLAAIERFSRLVVQSSSTLELHLRLAAAPTPASPGADPASPPVPGPELTITVPPGRMVSVPIPTPHAPEVDEFAVIVSGSSLKAELGSVSCVRERTEAESHFRLVGLPLEDPYSRLLELSGRSTGVPGWSSRWRELRPDFPIDVSPMLCTVASGTGEDEAAPPAIPPRALELTLDVAFPRFGDSVVLRVPVEYAARRFEVVAHNDAGPVARGTLDCVLPELAPGAAYELSTVWIRDARARPVRRVRELELGQAGQADSFEAAEVAPGRPCRRHYSRWVTELGEPSSGRDGWFPAWVCRPEHWEQATCVDGSGPVAKTPTIMAADVETSRSLTADVDLSSGSGQLRAIPPKTCYFDRVTKGKRSTCPVRCLPKLDVLTRDGYNRDFGLSCQRIYECVDRGQSC